MLIDFTDTKEFQHWITINDDVMGGISQSCIDQSPEATAVFSGHLSLEHNGGFASIRRRANRYHLNGCNGIMLKVKGDGRTYQFRVKTDEQYDGIAFRTLFASDIHQWQTLNLPFDSFSTSFRGRPQCQAPPFTSRTNQADWLSFCGQTTRIISSRNSLDKVVL